jgi:3-oxoacyl-[acyl-carrier-protein] synthase I
VQRPHVTAFTATCAAGTGNAQLWQALRESRSGLRENDFGASPLATWVGRVGGIETAALPAEFAAYECRNNRLAWLGLQQDGFLAAVDSARERHGAERVALVLGTSTSSIGATEEAYSRLSGGEFPEDLRRPAVHTPHSTADFVQRALRIAGVAFTVATACSSSAKAFAQGARMIELGIADAVVVGGVDSLCGSVLYGFNSLALISPEVCRPFDAARRGINIGEAAAFALLEASGGRYMLAGFGESSDAHHMSAPHPAGRGAQAAMEEALSMAGLPASAIEYVNLHGTASQKNDEIEAQVMKRLFPASTRASSTKGWTGHTLGAAGALEGVISLLAMDQGFSPGNLNTRELDAVCGPQIRLEGHAAPIAHALSNSFGFGGSNCALLFSASG